MRMTAEDDEEDGGKHASSSMSTWRQSCSDQLSYVRNQIDSNIRAFRWTCLSIGMICIAYGGQRWLSRVGGDDHPVSNLVTPYVL